MLEGIAFRVNDVLRAMEEASDTTISGLAVDGGASANDFLMQFQADISACTVIRPAVTEVTSLGAAYLAGLSCGYWKAEELFGNKVVERRFNAEMHEKKRAQLLCGWQQAIRRSRMQ